MKEWICQECLLQNVNYEGTTKGNLAQHQKTNKCKANQEKNRLLKIVSKENPKVKTVLEEKKEFLELRYELEQLRLENEELKLKITSLENNNNRVVDLVPMLTPEEIGRRMLKTYNSDYIKGAKGTALFIFHCCALNYNDDPMLYYDEKTKNFIWKDCDGDTIKTHLDWNLVSFHKKYLYHNFDMCTKQEFQKYKEILEKRLDYEEEELIFYLTFGERTIRNTFYGIFDMLPMIAELKILLINNQKSIFIPTQDDNNTYVSKLTPDEHIIPLQAIKYNPLFKLTKKEEQEDNEEEEEEEEEKETNQDD
jgi:hypothetical protein